MKLNPIKVTAFVIVVLALIICAMSLISVFPHKSTIAEMSAELSVPTANLVDKETVITALKENAQIVGMDGVITKEFRYTDAKWFGDKTYAMTLHGTFKTGFSVSAITADNVIVTESNEVIISTPATELISLELPYDRIEIDKDVAILRKDFTEADRQLLYAKASASIRKEIAEDAEVQKQALVASQQALRAILTLVPGVRKVTFN